MKKFFALFSSLAIVSFLVLPAFAQGDQVSDIQAQIDAILARIKNIQTQLNAQQGVSSGGTSSSPTPSSAPSSRGSTGSTQSSQPAGFCYKFARGLGVDSFGADVVALTSALVREGFLDHEQDGFDEDVSAAVVQFQARYGIRQTGFVGPLTRAKLNGLYGCGNNSSRVLSPSAVVSPDTTQPSITVLSPNGGEAFTPGSSITVRWSSNLPSNASITVSLLKGGNPVTTVNDLQNSGAYTLTLPSNASGDDYSVRVYRPGFCADLDGCTNEVSDRSDSSFGITTFGSITVTADRRQSIRQLYLTLLQREPDSQGWDYWTNGNLTLDQVKQGIINSYEYGQKKLVTGLYQELLHRAPDDQGLHYWYGLMYSSGWTLDQVRQGIKSSSEYQNSNPAAGTIPGQSVTVQTTPTNATQSADYDIRKQAVYNYYRSFLARDPDNQGLAFWLGSGLTVDYIKLNILNSEEYKSRRQAIKQLYLDLLKREPDQQGWDYWANNGLTIDQVRQGIKNSSEYQNLNPTTTSSTITVLSPNGGESYKVGDTVSISWNATGGPQYVGLNLIQNNSPVLGIGNVPNTGSYSWTVPSTFSGNNFKIRAYGEGVSDDSNSFFTITASTITAPTATSTATTTTTTSSTQAPANLSSAVSQAANAIEAIRVIIEKLKTQQ